MKVFNRAIKLVGQWRRINSIAIRVLEYDNVGHVLKVSGLTVPTGAGYAKGCIFVKTDAATGATSLYENVGSISVASFSLVGSMVGTDAAPLAHTLVTEKGFQVHTTISSTNTGVSYEPVLFSTELTGAGQVGGRVRAYMKTNVKLGGWANAFKAEIDFQTNGSITGLASAFVAEMTMPGSTPAGGNYGVLELELNCPTNFDAGSIVALSFMHLSAQGAAVGEFDDHGLLMNVQGIAAESGHLYQTGTTQAGSVSGTLKVKVLDTIHYISLYDAEATT